MPQGPAFFETKRKLKSITMKTRAPVELRDVVYYLAVAYVFLFAATRVLEARRWR